MGVWLSLSRVRAVGPKVLRILPIFCLITLLTRAQAQHASPSTPELDFQAAMTAKDRGDLDGAKTILLRLHRQHPGLFAVDESLGMIDVAQEKFADALPLLQDAAREQPSSDVAHLNLGADLYKLHRNTEALTEFEHAARLNSNNSTTQQSLGELWLEAGKPDQAAEAFAAALRLNPHNDELTFSYAAALVAGKRYDEASQTLAPVSTVDRSALAQSLLGEIEESKGNYKSAIDHFTRAVELEPSEENVWALDVEFLRHWTFDAAIREFEAAAVKFPASTRMKLGLGAAYFGGAKYQEAIPVFAGMLETDKNNALYAELLGMACTAVTESAAPRCAVLVKYAEEHPHNAKAATYAASMLLKQTAADTDSALARTLLNNALSTDPKLPDAQYQMGLLKQEGGDWTGSISHLQKAITLKPDYAQAHYRLGLAYWRTGRKQDGQAEMDLQKQYAQQEKQDLDRRLRQITTFIVDVRN